MATQITNRATLTFQYGTLTGSAISNIASTTLQGPLTIEKNALAEQYNGQDDITYIISFSNTTNSTLTDVVITDNLGSYNICQSLAIATPLDFEGPAALYINGSFVTYLQGITGPNSVSFNIGNLGSGDNALVIYRAKINDYALLTPFSSITNTAVVSANGITETATASATLEVGSYADVSIVKTMSPDPVSSGDLITYNFSLYNYGNTEARNVVLSDLFSPIPSITGITVNGTLISSNNYSYINGKLTLPTGLYNLTIPAATYTQNENGFVSKVPGLTTVTVVGTI